MGASERVRVLVCVCVCVCATCALAVEGGLRNPILLLLLAPPLSLFYLSFVSSLTTTKGTLFFFCFISMAVSPPRTS